MGHIPITMIHTLTNNTGSAITNFVILTLGQLHQQLGDLMFDLHLIQDSGTIIGYGDITIRRNKNLVQSYNT